MDFAKSGDKKVRIMVVEDEPAIAMLVGKRLKTQGYDVIATVSSGEEAVEKALEFIPDLVLMDIGLHGKMDGVTAAEKIRLVRDIPVVYLTGHSDPESLGRAKITEPFGYLVKPFQDIALKSTIEMALYKHRMESSLRRSEQRFATTLRSIGDAVIATDTTGEVTFLNPVAEKLIGWIQEDALGRNLSDILSIWEQDSAISLTDIIQTVIGEGNPVAQLGDVCLTTIDGKRVPVELNASPIRDDHGNLLGMVLVMLDMTGQKEAEQALRKSEKLLRSIFEVVPDSFSIIDKDHRIVLANRQKGSVDEPLGKGERTPFCYEVYYCRNDVCEPCHVREVFTTGKPAFTEKFIPEVGHVEISAYPILDDAGDVEMVAQHIRNITRHKQAEEALADEKERLAVTLRSIGDGVITTDTTGRIVLLNKVAEELTGWSQEEAMGRLLTEVFDISDEKSRQRCKSPVDLVLSTGGIAELANPTILISRDGRELVIADSGAPIRDRDSRIVGVVLVFRDITDKVKMENELFKAQKLESIGVLAGGIAHDFNNLLTAILGNISLAKMYVSEGDKIFQKLSEAEKASLRARDLTQQLLTFSRGGAPVKRTASIADIVKDSVSFTLSGSNVSCRFRIPDNLWTAEVDQGQISQVINNLIINSEQSMPGGGMIEVECKNLHVAAEDLIPVSAGRYIMISVSDHGIGIPAENLPKVFDPYFSTKKGGKGLGLTTVYSIVKNHGGCITSTSEPGAGTTFTIYLPSSGSDKFEPAEAVPQSSAGKARILVMDDEENIRDVVGEMLKCIGYECESARDGAEAVELYRKAAEAGAPFSAVLMDLTIPGGMGGREAVRVLLEMDPAVRAIVSSGYSNDPIMADYRAFGFHGVITKPYKVSDLREVLETVLSGG